MLKRERRFLFTALLLIGALAGCGSKPGPTQPSSASTEPGRYYSREHGFSIVLPTGWAKQENLANVSNPALGTNFTIVVAAVSPTEGSNDTFAENTLVGVLSFPSSISLTNFFELMRTDAESTLPGYRILEQGQVIINSNNAIWIVDSPGTGQLNLRGLKYFLVNGRKGYFVQSLAAPASFTAYRRIFEDTARSFRFE